MTHEEDYILGLIARGDKAERLERENDQLRAALKEELDKCETRKQYGERYYKMGFEAGVYHGIQSVMNRDEPVESVWVATEKVVTGLHDPIFGKIK